MEETWVFKLCFLKISHHSVGNCKVDYSNEQKKYDLSNNVFCKCPITVRAFVSFILLMWGRNVIFQIMFSANIASHCRHFSLLFWCGEDMWSLKLVFAVNIESQCRHLQGLLWIMIQNRDNNCLLVIFPFYELSQRASSDFHCMVPFGNNHFHLCFSNLLVQ